MITDREREILKYMADGLSDKKIAMLLGISKHTVHHHVSSILEKLHASNRTHAVVMSLRG